MKSISILALLLLSVVSLSSKGQNIDQLSQTAQRYHDKYVQEKLYLHLDKGSYTTGETIWFKAYSTIGVENLLSNWSRIAYVELIDPSSRQVGLIRIPLVNGLGVGDFALQDTLVEGSYRIRAYTNWMRNGDDQFFYDRTIPIGNGRSDNTYSHTTVGTDGQTYTIELEGFNGAKLRNTPVDFEIVEAGKKPRKQQGSTDHTGRVTLTLDAGSGNTTVRYSFLDADGRRVRKVLQPLNPSRTPDLQLLPEGGRLLSGFVNNIGVKAVDAQGLGIEARVSFVSGSDTLSVVRTNALGMGAGRVDLSKNRTFRAVAEFGDGSSQELPVPEVYSSGYALRLAALQDTLVSAQLSLSADRVDGRDIHFIVHHLGKVYLRATQAASSPQLDFSGSTTGFPTGVLTLSVLDADLAPLVERPFFQYRASDPSPLSMTLTKDSYATREQVKVDLSLAQAPNRPLVGVFSAAVHKLDSGAQDTVPTILSTLLLSSDIKGFIEDPGYYFNAGVPKLEDLDHLLLTQGWRSIDWRALDTAQVLPYVREFGIRVSGHTKKLGREVPEVGATVRLFPRLNMYDYKETRSASDGYFEFDDLFFSDRRGFVVTAKDRKGKNRIAIHVDEQELAEVGHNRNSPMELRDVNMLLSEEIRASREHFAQLERVGLMDAAIQIEEVVVTKNVGKASPRSKNRNGPGMADRVFNQKDMEGYTSLQGFMWDRLYHTLYDPSGIKTQWDSTIDMPLAIYFVDGQQARLAAVDGIDPDDLESVEMLWSRDGTDVYSMAYQGDLNEAGVNIVFLLTTKPGRNVWKSRKVEQGRAAIDPPGLHISRTYYKPTYETDSDRSKYTDLRRSIHWEPSIVINTSGKVSFDFYTSDEVGDYVITLEGLDLNGQLYRERLPFKVYNH